MPRWMGLQRIYKEKEKIWEIAQANEERRDLGRKKGHCDPLAWKAALPGTRGSSEGSSFAQAAWRRRQIWLPREFSASPAPWPWESSCPWLSPRPLPWNIQRLNQMILFQLTSVRSKLSPSSSQGKGTAGTCPRMPPLLSICPNDRHGACLSACLCSFLLNPIQPGLPQGSLPLARTSPHLPACLGTRSPFSTACSRWGPPRSPSKVSTWSCFVWCPVPRLSLQWLVFLWRFRGAGWGKGLGSECATVSPVISGVWGGLCSGSVWGHLSYTLTSEDPPVCLLRQTLLSLSCAHTSINTQRHTHTQTPPHLQKSESEKGC